MSDGRKHLPSIPAVQRRRRVARTSIGPDRCQRYIGAPSQRHCGTDAMTTPAHVYDVSSRAR